MSRAGAPELVLERTEDLRVAVVAARWHAEVMDGLLAGAPETLGRRLLDLWPEVQDALAPLLQGALRGESTRCRWRGE